MEVAGASSKACRFRCELADPEGKLLPRTAALPLPAMDADAEADHV